MLLGVLFLLGIVLCLWLLWARRPYSGGYKEAGPPDAKWDNNPGPSPYDNYF